MSAVTRVAANSHREQREVGIELDDDLRILLGVCCGFDIRECGPYFNGAGITKIRHLKSIPTPEIIKELRRAGMNVGDVATAVVAAEYYCDWRSRPTSSRDPFYIHFTATKFDHFLNAYKQGWYDYCRSLAHAMAMAEASSGNPRGTNELLVSLESDGGFKVDVLPKSAPAKVNGVPNSNSNSDNNHSENQSLNSSTERIRKLTSAGTLLSNKDCDDEAWIQRQLALNKLMVFLQRTHAIKRVHHSWDA